MKKETVTLQRAIPEDKKLRELDTPEIREKLDTHPASQDFTITAGGVTYWANSKEELMEIVSKIRSHRIQTQTGDTFEVHEKDGMFTALGPDRIAFQAASKKELVALVSQFHPVVAETEVEPVSLANLAVRESKIEETSAPVFTATIDGISYMAETRERLLAMVGQIHPLVDHMEQSDTRFRNLVFYPEQYPLS
jgi:hypothetical protein